MNKKQYEEWIKELEARVKYLEAQVRIFGKGYRFEGDFIISREGAEVHYIEVSE